MSSPRCVSPRINGTLPCDNSIELVDGSDYYICCRCRRKYTEGDLIWVRKVNQFEDMERARKAQGRAAKNPKAEWLA
jgi:hypothetical protein